MATKDTVAAIKAAHSVELDETAYSQKEQDQLQALATPDKQAEFDALRKQFDEDGVPPDDNTEEAPVAEDSTPTRKVRVNYASPDVSTGTAFIHPESRTVILDKLVSVPDDEWTQNFLAQRFLTEK